MFCFGVIHTGTTPIVRRSLVKNEKKRKRKNGGSQCAEKGEESGERKVPMRGKGGQARRWVGNSSKCPVEVLKNN